MASSASAEVRFTIERILAQGDPLPDGTEIQKFRAASVVNSGDWFVEVQSDGPFQQQNPMVLRDGSLFVAEGDPIDPEGSSVDFFESLDVDNGGHLGWLRELTDGEGADDFAIYRDLTPILRDRDLAIAPELPAGSSYALSAVESLDDQSRVVVEGDVRADGDLLDVLFVLEFDDLGDRVSESVVAWEGEHLPGLPGLVPGFLQKPGLINDRSRMPWHPPPCRGARPPTRSGWPPSPGSFRTPRMAWRSRCRPSSTPPADRATRSSTRRWLR